MEEQQFVLYLLHFGLTRQEALIYRELLEKGKQTGYEVAKEAGISRSNAYSSLAALVEKGAAYLLEESAKRYVPVELEVFCENHIRQLEAERQWLLANAPAGHAEEEGYITIEGEANIRDKIRNLLSHTEARVYLSCTHSYLELFSKELQGLISEEKKVVLISDEPFSMEGAQIFLTESKGRQIGLITDSKYALSGEFGAGGQNTCLYSGQKNFVEVFKTALGNEIKLIKLQEGESIL